MPFRQEDVRMRKVIISLAPVEAGLPVDKEALVEGLDLQPCRLIARVAVQQVDHRTGLSGGYALGQDVYKRQASCPSYKGSDLSPLRVCALHFYRVPFYINVRRRGILRRI